MTIDWMGVGGLVVGIVGIAFAYFSVTNEAFSNFLIRRRFKKMPSAFRDLAGEYRRADQIPNDSPDQRQLPVWDSRVREKDRLAEGLARFAQGANLDRDALARGDDGYLVALMKLVAIDPVADDTRRVAQAAMTDVPPHTDYATLKAISVLADRRLIPDDLRDSIAKAIDAITARLGTDHDDVAAAIRSKLRVS